MIYLKKDDTFVLAIYSRVDDTFLNCRVYGNAKKKKMFGLVLVNLRV